MPETTINATAIRASTTAGQIREKAGSRYISGPNETRLVTANSSAPPLATFR